MGLMITSTLVGATCDAPQRVLPAVTADDEPSCRRVFQRACRARLSIRCPFSNAFSVAWIHDPVSSGETVQLQKLKAIQSKGGFSQVKGRSQVL